MDVAVVGAGRERIRRAWIDAVEARIRVEAGVPVIRATTATSVITAATEAVKQGRRVAVACAAELDEGSVLDVIQACSPLGIGVVSLLEAGEVAIARDIAVEGRVPVVLRPEQNVSLLSTLRQVASPVQRRAANPSGHLGGKSIVVTSAGGGPGKSYVCGALAALLARRREPEAVIAVDLDLQFGVLDVLLGAHRGANHTLDRVLPALGELSRQDWLHATVQTSVGCHVLPRPTDPRLADSVDAKQIKLLLATLRNTFPVTVVDTAAHFDDRLVAAAQQADLVLLVATPQLLAARNTLRMANTLGELGVSGDRLRLVLNGLPHRPTGPVKDIVKRLEQQFESPPLARLPLVATPWSTWLERGEANPAPHTGEAAVALRDFAEAVSAHVSIGKGASR